jgi:hypothetical protein
MDSWMAPSKSTCFINVVVRIIVLVNFVMHVVN